MSIKFRIVDMSPKTFPYELHEWRKPRWWTPGAWVYVDAYASANEAFEAMTKRAIRPPDPPRYYDEAGRSIHFSH